MPIKHVNSEVLGNLYRESNNRGEGARKVLATVEHLLKPKDGGGEGLHMKNFSIKGLAIAFGVIDPMREADSYQQNMGEEAQGIRGDVLTEGLFSEANPGVNTTLFKQVTANLIHDSVIAGYENDEGFIGDRLVEVLPSKLRNQKIAGFTAFAGPNVVNEGFPYEESGFEEKFVTTSESKKGRILSINEELVMFDQTGEIARRAQNFGFMTLQERERTIVRGVIDADASSSIFVFRPAGVGETLYDDVGTNKNFIGVNNTTDADFNAAVPLVDWTDVETARRYRSVAPVDDRIDGTQLPIAGLNGNNILLVPENKFGAAINIMRSNSSQVVDNQANADTNRSNFPTQRLVMDVLSSPFIDAEGGQAINDWYYGRPNRQFIWTEIWPVRTAVQRADSESAFERDVVFRIKVSYYGGISATDTLWLTKVDGA